MPKARSKKKTEFSLSQERSVFLYGRPNKDKYELLSRMECAYTELVNSDIKLINSAESRFLLQLVKNDKKDPAVRAFEKANRPAGINSAFCQNAFDEAFTKLANRLDAIRLEMYRRDQTIFTQSKVLFAMSAAGKSRQAMAAAMSGIAASIKKDASFYLETAAFLNSITDADFRTAMLSFADEYAMASMVYQIPEVSRAQVPLDSRLMRFEESCSTSFTHVLTVTDPFQKCHRVSIPVSASGDGLRRLLQYGAAGTVHISVRPGRILRIQASFTKPHRKPHTDKTVGVDTGMKDCFSCSDGRSAGSMDQVIRFYKDTVEPSFGGLTSLRNKKRKILRYIRNHDLPAAVRQRLLHKADRLEQMIRTADAPYRKKRHYYAMLDKEAADSVRTYISGTDRDTLTVLERLDIKEFRKSRKLNGELSVFARGLLQKKLMEELNWNGMDFLEVEPDYSSQTCPVCGLIDSASRNGKVFCCTCCGHTDDADHNAAVNLKARASDQEFLDICDKDRFNHKALQKDIRTLWDGRHSRWQKIRTASA